jgi:hypothetical protein
MAVFCRGRLGQGLGYLNPVLEWNGQEGVFLIGRAKGWSQETTVHSAVLEIAVRTVKPSVSGVKKRARVLSIALVSEPLSAINFQHVLVVSPLVGQSARLGWHQ